MRQFGFYLNNELTIDLSSQDSFISAIKREAYRPEPVRRNLDEGRDSEGDLAFSFHDACIELGFKKVDDLLVSETGLLQA